jgi:hypothetical protein
MQRMVNFILFAGIFFFVSLSYANTFNFNPVNSLPTSVQQGQTVTAIYKVTSAGTFPPGQYHTIFALLSNPSNVTQDLTGPNACGTVPISPAGCLLKLTINGAVYGAVKICDDWQGQPGFNCNIPSNPNDFLSVTAIQSATITVSPATTFLGPNDTQIFTVTNSSSVTTAANITMTIPANIQAQLIGPPIYNGCDSIAPLSSCTIMITAITQPSGQSGAATIKGSNTTLPETTVLITTGAAPALTVSPVTTTLGPNDSQVFTVVNTSTTTTATDVTITVPSNVQAELSGQPVYNGCGAIAPLANCTISISANASPNAQSGMATIQGTNTAAPAPIVSITTGAAPALTVSPPTTVLGPNDSQIFTVINTSTTNTATAITMAIPANVQSQLIGLPIYNGCNSIAPLGNCTITITAVGSPGGQSGIATIQGTNTAAPFPTVAITTGAAPALTVSPPTTVLGPNNSQVFTVVNTSSTNAANDVTITIPSNVQAQLVGSPVYNGCNLITPLSSCTITITAVASPNGQSGIATIQGTNTAAPAPTVAITTGTAPALTVSPPTTILGPNELQQFVVTNTSINIAAQNITMTIPPNVQGQLTSLPVYNGCTSIAPQGTCTITITAIASPNAQSNTATVQGTNTAAPAPAVAITTGAAPVLTVGPSTTILGPNDSELFTVTNTSNTITAENVTMTIPANVQGQLTSPPVYNGCTSITPQATCTITITAIASPNAQSGTATIQGTNTAAPSPEVTITTGAAPTLTVSPSSANIASNSQQQFIVTNTGTIPAQNISMTIPPNVQNQLTGQPLYSPGCTTLAPTSSACTITIQAISSPSSQSGVASVQGTNTAAPSPSVNIFILPVCTILGGSTVTNTGNSQIIGGVCVAPGVAITGFPPGQTSPANELHSNDSIANTNHSDANNLYASIVALTCEHNLSGQDLGGMTLPPGVYCFNAGSTIAAGSTLTLSGALTDKWYFQIGTTLTTGANSSVTFTGGAVAGNVYWQIGSSGTFGANTAFKGQVIALTSLTVGAGMNNNGRLWVTNAAITLDTNSVGP